MLKREIINALSHSAGWARRPPGDCLEAEELALYFEGKLGEEQTAGVEAHLADCDECLGLVAAMSRSREEEPMATVPATVLARATALVKPGPGTQRWSSGAQRWAVAATLVLALGVSLLQYLPAPPVDAPAPVPQTRYADAQAMAPELLSPVAGSRIAPAEQQFTWSAVPGTMFYDIRLVSEDGDLLWQERVNDTHWQLPRGLTLESDNEYFVRVDAYLSDAKYLSSEHLVFTVNGQH